MRRSMLTMLALLAVATSGCEQVKGLIARIRGTDTTATAAAPPPPADTALTPTTPATGPSTGAQAPPPPEMPQSPVLLRDEPYVSDDTGTIAPGMTEREVYALWGAPAAVRKSGDMTYLYFKNGCEYTCGTMDVVFLQGGSVVDAIVRWPGHGYSGESSSPPGRKGAPTAAPLTMPTPDA